MVPLILRVEVEGELVEVPLTPVTTCRDVIDCIRDPGPEHCLLVHSPSCKVLKENDKPLEVLQRLGTQEHQPNFTLRYTLLPPGGGSPERRNGMKETDSYGDSVWRAELSVAELEAMAMRQQEEMASGRALLAAKEARLRALRQAGPRPDDRLRRLRDRVQAQEHKLARLRALRGQLDHTRLNNTTLTSDLESIKALFNEKEKELTLAVAKVEELTRQLEEVRRGKGQPASSPAHLHEQQIELDRLRRELMYRNKLNEQQSLKLSEQQEMLCQRQLEMASIDKRIAELQERLQRKRYLNQQLANQINSAAAANNNQSTNQNHSPGHHPPKYNQSFSAIAKPMLRNVTSGNIAAIEPFHHVPSYQNSLPIQECLKSTDHSRVDNQGGVNNNGPEVKPAPATHHYVQETARKEPLSEEWRRDGDGEAPRYQTLPRLGPAGRAARKPGEGDEAPAEPEPLRNGLGQVAHSAPTASRGLALGPRLAPSASPSSASSASSNSSFPTHGPFSNRIYGGMPTRGQPVGGTSSTTSSTSSLATSSSSSTNQPQKPISAVPPTLQNSSSFYQTTSTKIHPVQPQTMSPPQVILKEESETSKPALPPKPAFPVKPTPPPPPRQTHGASDGTGLAGRPSDLQRQESRNADLGPPRMDLTSSRSELTPVRPTDLSLSRIPDLGPPLRSDNRPLPPQPPQMDLRQPPTGSVGDHRPVDVSSEAVDNALSVLRGTYNSNNNNNRISREDDGRKPEQIIKPRPLTIRKQPASEMPRLKNQSQDATELIDAKRRNSSERVDNENLKNSRENGLVNGCDSSEESNGVQFRESRRIEMPPAFLFPESQKQDTRTQEDGDSPSSESLDETDRSAPNEDSDDSKDNSDVCLRRVKKGNLKGCSGEKTCLSRRVSFDPLALLLDAALEGELELVMRTAAQVKDPSAANDEGITALHNAICAGHFDIVTFLVEFGCDVNAQDSDGWTPLHCAASCNNLAMVRFLVEHGACIFATTLSDHETAAEKCEEDEEGFDGCSEYLYSVQEKLGIMNCGVVFSVFDYEAHNSDELSFKEGDRITVIRKGDECEREWWWARLNDKEGYIPRNLLGLYARVCTNKKLD